MVEAIVRKQKFAKCQTAIDMLFTLNFYMQQAKWLKQQAELDTDMDGNTSKRSMPAFVPKDVTEEKAYEELQELFEHFDSDGSGELGSDEVGELLATMGVNLNAEELAKLIQMMDKDGSGALTCLLHVCAVLRAVCAVLRARVRLRVCARVHVLTSREQQVKFLWMS